MKTLVTCFLFGVAFTSIAAADRTEEYRCTFTDGMTLTISNVAGSVIISPWDKDEIFLRARLEDRVEKLQVQCEDRNLDIQVVIPKKGGRKISAYLELFLPENRLATIKKQHIMTVGANIKMEKAVGELTLESISGDINASGTMDSLEITTVSGTIRTSGSAPRATAESISGDIQFGGQYDRIKASSISGTLRLKGAADTVTLGTTSGDIVIDSVTRDLEMGSVSGTLRANDCRGDVEGSTMSGDIIIVGTNLEDVELGSMSGTISLSGTLTPDGDVEAESKSGDIRLRLPHTTPIAVEAETHSGDITCDFPGANVKTPKFGPGSSLELEYGEATCDLELTSFSGTISIKRE